MDMSGLMDSIVTALIEALQTFLVDFVTQLVTGVFA